MHGSSATMFSKQKICLQRSEQKECIVKIFSAIVIWQSGKIAPWTDLVGKVYRQDLMTRRNWVHYYPSLSSIGEYFFVLNIGALGIKITSLLSYTFAKCLEIGGDCISGLAHRKMGISLNCYYDKIQFKCSKFNSCVPFFIQN